MRGQAACSRGWPIPYLMSFDAHFAMRERLFAFPIESIPVQTGPLEILYLFVFTHVSQNRFPLLGDMLQ
ncbi:hypothetical protein F9K81_14855 [Brucella anthropi]|nr:hypothetical protein F9K81_14855 [Brucella anthropi]KAB2768327.1 hypothetical protein F9K84_14265 [Brucella anthropi]